MQFLRLVEARKRADLGAGEDVGDEVGRHVFVVVGGERGETVQQEDSALKKTIKIFPKVQNDAKSFKKKKNRL